MIKFLTVRCLFLFCCFIFLFAISGPILAGTPQDNTGGYRLGPGDVLKMSILAGGEEQVSQNLVVGGEGGINVPFIGKLQGAGLTLQELEKQIIIPLERDFFVDPQVYLQIDEYHSLQFFISGAVKNPGIYSLDFTPTFLDLLANAGGALPERGNLAYILRGVKDISLTESDLTESELKDTISGTEPIIVDLDKLLDAGDMSGNLRLQSGDTVYIPLGTRLHQSTTKVYVQGEVRTPGVFNFQPGMTALAACIMAQGFSKYAAPNRARIIRQSKDGQIVIKIDLEAIQEGEEPDVPLKPGDSIHIPEAWL
jgi:polysaccharide biosynthesis/export protein